MFVKPLVFNSLDTVCTQRVFTKIAQSKASSIILFFVLCDNRKKYFTIWDQTLVLKGNFPTSFLLTRLLEFFGMFKQYLMKLS